MTKKIKILPNGPYEISADVPLKKNTILTDKEGVSTAWGEGKTYDTPKDKPYHVCRCGRSKKSPFCDGAHAKIGFKGTETADNAPYMENVTVYKGPHGTLLDNEALCAVGRFCDRAGQVWNLIEEDSKESFDTAVEEACNCPAGRLTIVKDGKHIEPKLPQEVGAVQDPQKNHRGPLWVKGGIEVEGATGVKYEKRNRVTLCRCGESGNMPFCDASHLMCKHMEKPDA
ncbi:MAG: CDGSH iron-sulfur domain-containing protein [Elusimicrobiota bacterium]|jgi:CDGSH-type Zn-finger protein|nr:CDGSH iron-sulfur domain-containing protein [Elusimicrobiota bacterium]